MKKDSSKQMLFEMMHKAGGMPLKEEDDIARRFTTNPHYNYNNDAGQTNIAPDDREQYAKDGMDKDLLKLQDLIGGWDELKSYIDDLIIRTSTDGGMN